MKNIAVFASGRGSNFQKIYENSVNGKIPARICCLISDNPAAEALAFAKQNRIPAYSIPPKEFGSQEEFGVALLDVLHKFRAEWVVLAGYLKKIPDNVVSAFSNRILNIHPALLPSFGGKGMYGQRVHQAVFNAGVRVSGITVHLVNMEYDAGPIVAQKAVEISHCTSPEQIGREVLKTEHLLYSETIARVLTRKFRVEGRRVIFEEDLRLSGKG